MNFLSALSQPDSLGSKLIGLLFGSLQNLKMQEVLIFDDKVTGAKTLKSYKNNG